MTVTYSWTSHLLVLRTFRKRTSEIRTSIQFSKRIHPTVKLDTSNTTIVVPSKKTPSSLPTNLSPQPPPTYPRAEGGHGRGPSSWSTGEIWAHLRPTTLSPVCHRRKSLSYTKRPERVFGLSHRQLADSLPPIYLSHVCTCTCVYPRCVLAFRVVVRKSLSSLFVNWAI